MPDQTTTTPKWMFWAGWVVTALPALSLIFSAIFKFIQPQQILKEFDRLGWQGASVMPLGIVELACTIVYLIPQTSVLGAILLTGYLGGATATHVRINDNFVPPLVMGALVWLGLFLRDARLRALIPLRR
jgi:xanthine/uracil permease